MIRGEQGMRRFTGISVRLTQLRIVASSRSYWATLTFIFIMDSNFQKMYGTEASLCQKLRDSYNIEHRFHVENRKYKASEVAWLRSQFGPVLPKFQGTNKEQNRSNFPEIEGKLKGN